MTTATANVNSPTQKPPVTPAKPAMTPSASPAQKVMSPPPFQMGQTKDQGRYLKFLVYGRPGIGKTELCATAADVQEMNDILFVDCEKGEMTIHDNPRIVNWESLIDTRVSVKTFKEVSSVHDWLVGHCKARDAAAQGNEQAIKALIENEARLRGVSPSEISKPKLFRTVMLDTLSEIDAMSNMELLGVDEAKVLTGDADQVEVATWDEFRKNNQRIQMLTRAFRNLPMNILVTAHEQYKQDELKKFHYEPKVTGQLARQVQGAFDIVGYYTMGKQGEKVERRVYVQPVANFDAKCRLAKFTAQYFGESQLNMKEIMKLTGLTK